MKKLIISIALVYSAALSAQQFKVVNVNTGTIIVGNVYTSGSTVQFIQTGSTAPIQTVVPLNYRVSGLRGPQTPRAPQQPNVPSAPVVKTGNYLMDMNIFQPPVCTPPTYLMENSYPNGTFRW